MRRPVAPRLAAVTLAIAASAAAVASFGCSAMRPLASIGKEKEQQFTMDRDGATDASVHVSYWSGRLHARPGDAARAARLHTHDNLDAILSHADARREGEHLEVRLWLDSEDSIVNFRTWEHGDVPPAERDPKHDVINDWDLELAEGLPLALDFELAACDADVDLGGLLLHRAKLELGGGNLALDFERAQAGRLERLDLGCGAGHLEVRRLGNAHARTIRVDVGAGSCRLDLAGDWKEDALLRVDAGTSNVEIHVPRGLAVRADLKETLARLSAPEFQSEGSQRYTTPEWGTGGPSIVIELEATLGSVSLLRD